MQGMTIGRSVGEANEWFENVLEKYGHFLEDQYAFSITLENLQRTYEVELSPSAVLLLAAPILELIEAREKTQSDVPELQLPSKDVVEDTLNKLVYGAKQEPTKYVDAINTKISGTPDIPGRLRVSLDIIRQFWKNFCDMPPFCGETDKQ